MGGRGSGGQNFIDMTGAKFGHSTVVQLMSERYQGRQAAVWLCQCDCGGPPTAVTGTDLRRGHTSTCGCGRTTHGLYHHELYHIYGSIIDRCENPNHQFYSHYGALGIKVCERWRHSFPNFLEDMGERPPGRGRKGKSKWMIDRYPDPYGNYEKDNCRWATPRQSALNRRRTVICGVRLRPSGHYETDIKMRTEDKSVYLGTCTTQAEASTIRKLAEFARDKDLAVRRGEGGGLVFVEHGVRMRRSALTKLLPGETMKRIAETVRRAIVAGGRLASGAPR